MADKEYKIRFKIETGKAEAGVKKVNQQLDNTGKKIGGVGKAGGAFNQLAGSIGSVIPQLNLLRVALISTGVGAIVVAIGGLIKFFSEAAQKGKEFEGAVAGLGAISGSTSEELEVLTNQAKELGATTIFTASEVVGLQTELAKLGFEAADIANSTPAILDLAASLDVSLAEAAEFAGATVRGFGLTTEETARVVDVMAKSAVSSAQDFGTLRESFTKVAPTARAVGVSVEETAALLGVMANAGLKGSIAGTGLSKTFIELNKKGLTLDQALDRVKNSSDQLGTAIDLVGVVGGRSLLTLANNTEGIEELSEAMNGAEGAAEALAAQRFDTLIGDQKALSSAWEGFLLAIEDGTGPLNQVRRFLTQALTGAITFLREAVERTAFFIPDEIKSMSLRVKGDLKLIGGFFDLLGANIQRFALNVILSISKIPIIGQAIDEDAIRGRLASAEQAINDAEDKIEEGRAMRAESRRLNETREARFLEEQKGAELRRTKKKEQELIDEQQAEFDAEAEERQKEREEQRKKDLEALAKIEDDFRKKQQDKEAQSNVDKVNLQEQRALEDLEKLKLTETEKEEAKLAIENYYKELRKEAEEKDQEEQLAKDEKLIADNQKKLDTLAKAEENLEKVKRDARNKTFDDAVKLAGEDSKLGKAILIAKQILAFKEEMLERKKTMVAAQSQLKQAQTDVAKAGTAQAQGLSETAKIGFPQNIPMLIAYAAQAVGFVSAIKSAFGKTKAAVSSVGGSTGADPQLETISAPTQAIPEVEPVIPGLGVGDVGTNAIASALANQAPVQAFVVANDVTTAQSLQRNTVEGASI